MLSFRLRRPWMLAIVVVLAGCGGQDVAVQPLQPATRLASAAPGPDANDTPSQPVSRDFKPPYPRRTNPFDSPAKVDREQTDSEKGKVLYQGRIVTDRPRVVLVIDGEPVVLGEEETAMGVRVIRIRGQEVWFEHQGRQKTAHLAQ